MGHGNKNTVQFGATADGIQRPASAFLSSVGPSMARSFPVVSLAFSFYENLKSGRGGVAFNVSGCDRADGQSDQPDKCHLARVHGLSGRAKWSASKRVAAI